MRHDIAHLLIIVAASSASSAGCAVRVLTSARRHSTSSGLTPARGAGTSDGGRFFVDSRGFGSFGLLSARDEVVVMGRRQPPGQVTTRHVRRAGCALGASLLLAACAQTPGVSDITTASISSPASVAQADLPSNIPGETMEARLARLEYDLAQLKLDYSIVRPSFEQLVSREGELDQRMAALESALGPITASVPKAAPKPAQSKPAAAPKPAQSKPAAAPKPAQSKPAAAPKPAITEPAPQAANPQTSSAAAVGLHLASYRTLDRLKEGWAELKAAHPSELTGLDVRIQRIDTGKNGVFRRLLAGPINSRTAANGLCQALSAKGVYCKTVTFSGSAL
jgi:cell division septation protein DedD